MGQSEKVECALPPCRALLGARVAERNQRRLLRMDAQAKAGKPLGEYRQDPSGVRFPLAADDKVIGETSQKASALQAGLDLLCKPRIQDMMEHDIGQHG